MGSPPPPQPSMSLPYTKEEQASPSSPQPSASSPHTMHGQRSRIGNGQNTTRTNTTTLKYLQDGTNIGTNINGTVTREVTSTANPNRFCWEKINPPNHQKREDLRPRRQIPMDIPNNHPTTHPKSQKRMTQPPHGSQTIWTIPSTMMNHPSGSPDTSTSHLNLHPNGLQNTWRTTNSAF